MRTVIVSGFLAACLGGCAPRFPPIAADLRSDTNFKARIATHFPPGSPAERLRFELAREEFVILDDVPLRRHSATDRRANIPCLSYTRIDWTEDRRGRIAEIQATRLDCS